MLCVYKEIFGKPYEGFHKDRIFGLAFNDVIGTVIIALITSYYYNIEMYKVIIFSLIFIVIIHRLFCVDTALNVALIGKIQDS